MLRQPENIPGTPVRAAVPQPAPVAAANLNSPVVAPPAARPVAANDVIEIPLHGRIAAGMPIEAMEGQTMLPIPAALLGSGEHYAL